MADFESSIEFYAKTLKVPHSELQTVGLIASGLNAQTRSRLVFDNQRYSSNDLHQLAVQATSFRQSTLYRVHLWVRLVLMVLM